MHWISRVLLGAAAHLAIESILGIVERKNGC